MNEENKIILYQDDDEITRVSVRFADEDLWLTQNQGQSENSVAILLSGYSFVSLRHETMASITDSIS